MILDFTKRTVAPGVAVLAMTGSIHCGPECARLEREVDALIAARETRVIFDMAGVTHADSAAIGSMVRCLGKLRGAGGRLEASSAWLTGVNGVEALGWPGRIEKIKARALAVARWPG